MNARKVREDLGRAKACCARRDTERALFLTISALKELGGQSAPLDLRGDFRAAVADLAVDPELKAAGAPALSTILRSTAQSSVSPSLEIPLPYMISNSACLNGGATLFLTILTLVLFPTI